MREFSKVNPSVWASKRFLSLTDDGKLFYLYSLTAGISNSCGCYRLPMGYVMEDIGWQKAKINTVCHTVSQTGLIQYDSEESVIYIDRWYEYNPPNNPKHCLKVISELSLVPECSIRSLNAKDLFAFIKTRPWEKENILSKLKPLLDDTVSDTVSRLGDTETKTETKTETEDNPKGLSSTGNKKAVERPADVEEGVWADFLGLRKQKRAPMTPTALEGLQREAEKAGISLNDALRECCARGWQGFKSEWLNAKGNNYGNNNNGNKPTGNKSERARAAALRGAAHNSGEEQ